MNLSYSSNVKYDSYFKAFFNVKLYEISSFTLNENNFLSSSKSITNGIKYDSETEKEFAQSMDINDDVEIYAKLPKTYKIPTPLGNYSPDWAIVCKKENNEQEER